MDKDRKLERDKKTMHTIPKEIDKEKRNTSVHFSGNIAEKTTRWTESWWNNRYDPEERSRKRSSFYYFHRRYRSERCPKERGKFYGGEPTLIPPKKTPPGFASAIAIVTMNMVTVKIIDMHRRITKTFYIGERDVSFT